MILPLNAHICMCTYKYVQNNNNKCIHNYLYCNKLKSLFINILFLKCSNTVEIFFHTFIVLKCIVKIVSMTMMKRPKKCTASLFSLAIMLYAPNVTTQSTTGNVLFAAGLCGLDYFLFKSLI